MTVKYGKCTSALSFIGNWYS